MQSDRLKKAGSFLSYLQFEQRNIWRSITRVDEEGLLFIDEENDAVKISDSLPQTYPELDHVIHLLVKMWNNKRSCEQ